MCSRTTWKNSLSTRSLITPTWSKRHPTAGSALYQSSGTCCKISRLWTTVSPRGTLTVLQRILNNDFLFLKYLLENNVFKYSETSQVSRYAVTWFILRNNSKTHGNFVSLLGSQSSMKEMDTSQVWAPAWNFRVQGFSSSLKYEDAPTDKWMYHTNHLVHHYFLFQLKCSNDYFLDISYQGKACYEWYTAETDGSKFC